MQKRLFIYVFCLTALMAHAQTVKPDYFTREVSFTTENDAYLFQKRDAYYTNGFFFALRTAKEKKGSKVIRAYEIGQMIFTPLSRNVLSQSDIDRPYCGYLFFKYTQSQFQQDNSVLQFNAGIGQVGQASFGEDVQNSYHKLLGYSRFSGWQYQVQNAMGVDIGVTYAATLLEDSAWLKLMPAAQLNLGTTFTNARLGTYLCLGSFENNRNSALWNARVQNRHTPTRKKFEFFVYWYPQLIFQGYNATVQGGLFSKGSGAILGEIEPLMYQQSLGVCYARDRWTANVSLIYQSKEAVTQKRAQEYGSVLVSYRLH